MKETIPTGDDPRQTYLAWANGLMAGESVGRLVGQAHADRAAVASSAVIFKPPLERLQTRLTLPEEGNGSGIEEEEKVTIVAEFEMSQLSTLAITSLKNYLVELNLRSAEWPIRYADNNSRKLDQLVKRDGLRFRAERLVLRTSNAMDLHIKHKVPIGNIPEDALDVTLDESDLRLQIVGALAREGITTYGDLGILSTNQLAKISGIWVGSIEDIKSELARLGWLSPAFK